MKKIYIILASALALSVGSGATTIPVGVSDNVFTPDNFTCNVGDTIVWMWVNGNHTTTSTSIPVGAIGWDNMISQNSPSYTYVVSRAGTYDYQCTYHYMMGMIGHFTAEESSGIQESIAGVNMNIFANPVSKELQVDLRSSKSGQLNITLNDITGREVKMLASGQQSAGEHHLRYNVADLPKGLYLLKFSFNNEDLVRKIIVQ